MGDNEKLHVVEEGSESKKSARPIRLLQTVEPTADALAEIDSRTKVHVIVVQPMGKFTLSGLFDMCPRHTKRSRRLTEENLTKHLSRQVIYSPHEIPMAFIRFMRPMSALQVTKIRSSVDVRLYPAGLYDLLLQAMIADPSFFEGKYIVDPDTIIYTDGVEFIPVIDGRYAGPDFEASAFEFGLAERSKVFQAGEVWFASMCSNPALRPEPPNQDVGIELTE